MDSKSYMTCYTTLRWQSFPCSSLHKTYFCWYWPLWHLQLLITQEDIGDRDRIERKFTSLSQKEIPVRYIVQHPRFYTYCHKEEICFCKFKVFPNLKLLVDWHRNPMSFERRKALPKWNHLLKAKKHHHHFCPFVQAVHSVTAVLAG